MATCLKIVVDTDQQNPYKEATVFLNKITLKFNKFVICDYKGPILSKQIFGKYVNKKSRLSPIDAPSAPEPRKIQKANNLFLLRPNQGQNTYLQKTKLRLQSLMRLSCLEK
jgi:hypothetical protein